ncbi:MULTISPECIES: DEAD/DEAH box helicase [unclassified Granulicatella]|uniref:DEAD/DEAH box helicase n=1 Tax=unclassified Granulicatella TaxID=2630493 RepID=UPI001430AE6D|nr:MULTISPECIES: AAA domain-containing protein [unclassified Granulicatella]MBF0780485.1 ATP-binding protein [Granulicatella sp. 19428wC4_WM01]
MAGYVRKNKAIPNNLNLIEEDIREKFDKDFYEQGFNLTFRKILKQYEVDEKNFRMIFVRNIEQSIVNMHSFFIDDLRKAKELDTHNLNRYLNMFGINRVNLDSNAKSCNFNPNIFDEILQPINYPMGRFPSNPDFSLSFMQQVTVNLYLNDINDILSVNGPPGTGKTTLLKDIFADLVVRQAYEMSITMNSPLKNELKYFKDNTISVLSSKISKYNMLVASSNNAAVQNIVGDLPLKKDIFEEFIPLIEEVDYFTYSSNSRYEKIYNEKSEKYDCDLVQKEGKNKSWGMFSFEGGASTNLNKLCNKIQSMTDELDNWNLSSKNEVEIIEEFHKLYEEVSSYKKIMQSFFMKFKYLKDLKKELKNKKEALKLHESQKVEVENRILNIDREIRELERKKQIQEDEILKVREKLNLNEYEIQRTKRNFEVIKMQIPQENVISKLIRLFRKSNQQNLYDRLNHENNTLNQLEIYNKELLKQISSINQKITDCTTDIGCRRDCKYSINEEYESKKNNLNRFVLNTQKMILELEDKLTQENVRCVDFGLRYEELQKSNPWFDKEFRILQTKLFICALKVRKLYLYKNNKSLKAAKSIFERQNEHISKENGKLLIKTAWEWINLAIPVVSSTFASFGRMFRNFDEDSLGALFIDEAGQALPQASVGSIFRSKKVMVVGDPSQIKPVLTLDSKMMNLIARLYQVDENFVSKDASTQSLVDTTSQYGFQKNEEKWIGIPLWVHRRSNYPMFSIANRISYNDLMVQGKEGNSAYGKAFWYDVKGIADNKYVEEQGDKLVELIQEKLSKNPDLKDKIYVISPFKNVATKLIEKLDSIHFVIKGVNGKVINVGTVHTFQGKEANIVYFVLGADNNSQGAARWAFSEPNIVNVAATRAKEEFYIIGDKTLYSKLGSEIALQTIEIIDKYNGQSDTKEHTCV